jgi:transcriptional regulator GlxA family with amidase domain
LRGLPASTLIASVCTGGMIVAAAGLLDGHKATTRRCGIPSEPTPLELMGKSNPKVEPVEALIVDNGRIITGGGVSLSLDTMFYLLARILGPAAADEVARLTEYTHARRANQTHLKSYIS